MKARSLYIAALAVSIGLAASVQAQQTKTQAQQFEEAQRAENSQEQVQKKSEQQKKAEKNRQRNKKQQKDREAANSANNAAAGAGAAAPAAAEPVPAATPGAAPAAAAETPVPAAAALPEGLRGFDGTLSGTVIGAREDGEYLVLRPNRILHVSPRSTATKTESVLGYDLMIYPGQGQYANEPLQRQWIKSLHVNRVGDDKVPVDVKDVDGKMRINVLTPEAQQEAEKFAGAAQVATLPEALRGFDGTLSGTVVSADKDGEYFVLRPNRVLHTSPQSTAAKPESVSGTDVTIYPGLSEHGDPALQRQWIQSLHANRIGDDKVPVDVKEVDGKLRINALTPEAQQAAAQLKPEAK